MQIGVLTVVLAVTRLSVTDAITYSMAVRVTIPFLPMEVMTGLPLVREQIKSTAAKVSILLFITTLPMEMAVRYLYAK